MRKTMPASNVRKCTRWFYGDQLDKGLSRFFDERLEASDRLVARRNSKSQIVPEVSVHLFADGIVSSIRCMERHFLRYHHINRTHHLQQIEPRCAQDIKLVGILDNRRWNLKGGRFQDADMSCAFYCTSECDSLRME